MLLTRITWTTKADFLSTLLQISTVTGNEVSVSSDKCGIVVEPDSVLENYRNDVPYFNQRFVSGYSYARQCYGNNTATQLCSSYKIPALPIHMSNTTDCPFPGKEQICLPNSTTLTLDTGLLDSHDHLGINTPPSNRFAFRRVDQCIPLVVDKYSHINSSKPFTASNASVEYRYGMQNDDTDLVDPATFRIPVPSYIATLDQNLDAKVSMDTPGFALMYGQPICTCCPD